MTSDPNKRNDKKGPADERNPRLEQSGASDQSIQDVHATLLREKEEPSEGYPRMPLFVVFLFSGLILFGGIYMADYGGRFDPMVYDETAGLEREEREPEEFDPIVAGERVYRQQCMACHQANGEGVAGAFPPLNDTEWVTGSKDRVIRVVLNGLQGPIEVRGNSYDGVMTPFSHLSDQQVAAVLTYIRQEWDNDASEVTEEEVAAVRSEVGTRPQWTAEELEAYVD